MMTPLLAVALVTSMVSGTWHHHRGDGGQAGQCVGPIPTELAPLWKVKTEGPMLSTPVVDDAYVYVGTADGHVMSLERNTGEKRWATKLGEPIESPVTLDADAAYVGDTAGVIRKLGRDTGAVGWSFQTEAKIQGAATISGPLLLVGSYDRNLYGLERATGAERWR